MASAFSDVARSSRKGRDRPWRNALRLDCNRPAVLGLVMAVGNSSLFLGAPSVGRRLTAR
jgi:hypothetical protein